jgi:hypothetical protein
MLSSQEAAWRRWYSHSHFEILAWSLLRDTEARLHRDLSMARARRKILRSRDFSKPRSPRPESLRKALHWRKWPKTLQACLDQLAAESGLTHSSGGGQKPSLPAPVWNAEQLQLLPSVLKPEQLLATDRLWELQILNLALRAGSPVLRTELEIPIRGLGPTEERIRSWAAQSGWVSLLATYSPQGPESPASENSARAPARFHWYFTRLPDVPEPPWEELWSLISK